VIAATIGVPGLGLEVLQGLQRLQVGRALAAGLAIVAVAIVLDRVTFGWSESERTRRGSKTVHVYGVTISRRVLALLLVVGVIAAIFVGRQVLRQQDFPAQWVVSIVKPVDS